VSASAREQARETADGYLAGRINAIEAALILAGLRDGLPEAPEAIFDTFAVISSETDTILLGERRSLWHPAVRAREDAKHDHAQDWARPLMDEACCALLTALPPQ
jgi:hypothetical protein